MPTAILKDKCYFPRRQTLFGLVCTLPVGSTRPLWGRNPSLRTFCLYHVLQQPTSPCPCLRSWSFLSSPSLSSPEGDRVLQLPSSTLCLSSEGLGSGLGLAPESFRSMGTPASPVGWYKSSYPESGHHLWPSRLGTNNTYGKVSLKDRQAKSLSGECQAQGPQARGSVTRNLTGLWERLAADLEGRVSGVPLTRFPSTGVISIPYCTQLSLLGIKLRSSCLYGKCFPD